MVKENNSNEILINSEKKNIFTESIKTIRTNLSFSAVDKGMQVILITSAMQGDGKSFIAANLAMAYKDENKKVLLIDGDLRLGGQSKIFNVVNCTNKGYSKLILNYHDNENIDNYIIKTNEGIDLIPSGPVPPNPIELLSSNNNEKIINLLKKKYDVIIIDSTPIFGISDAIVMTKYSDANILVVSNKKTKLEMVSKADKLFKQANSILTGVIINKVDIDKGKKSYGYYSYAYYGDKK